MPISAPSLATAARIAPAWAATSSLVAALCSATIEQCCTPLDRQQWPEVVGTVAGDDTILVVLPDNSAAEAFRQKLLGIVEVGS